MVVQLILHLFEPLIIGLVAQLVEHQPPKAQVRFPGKIAKSTIFPPFPPHFVGGGNGRFRL